MMLHKNGPIVNPLLQLEINRIVDLVGYGALTYLIL